MAHFTLYIQIPNAGWLSRLIRLLRAQRRVFTVFCETGNDFFTWFFCSELLIMLDINEFTVF